MTSEWVQGPHTCTVAFPGQGSRFVIPTVGFDSPRHPTFTTTMQTKTKPALDDALACWPPKAHIIHKRDQPAKKGTIALCGAKLMGIDLPDDTPPCDKCLKVFRQLTS